MAYIELGIDEDALPGLLGLTKYRPDAAAPMAELIEVLLRGPNTLTLGERELIAAYVSKVNDCEFCQEAHGATSAEQIDGGRPLVDQVLRDLDSAPLGPKMKALLRIAEAAAFSGRTVTPELVADAQAAGASDLEVHDTVLITAAFALVNRYIDGLGALTPRDPELYKGIAQVVAEVGYTAVLAPAEGS